MEEYELPVSPSPLMINPGAHCLAFLPMQDSRGYLQYSAALRPHRLLRSVPLLLLSRSIYSICVSLSLSVRMYVQYARLLWRASLPCTGLFSSLLLSFLLVSGSRNWRGHHCCSIQPGEKRRKKKKKKKKKQSLMRVCMCMWRYNQLDRGRVGRASVDGTVVVSGGKESERAESI